MFSFAKKSVKRSLSLMASKSAELWKIQTLNQLRYKFNALREGIEINKSEKTVLFNLRRNIHRLEKGLSYPTAKSVFAEDYVTATVKLLSVGLRTDELDEHTICWATSVLSLYFQVVQETPIIKEAKSTFDELLLKLGDSYKKDHVPYLSSKRPDLNISYSELMNLSIRRRSVRYFEDKKVDLNVVKQAYDIAKYAPSACNRQSFQFLFYNEKELVDKLANVPGGVAGYTLPAVIVVVGRYDGYFDVRDINAPVIDASLSIMSFLYAAETLGLGTVCINWPNLPDREKKIRKLLDIKSYEFVIMMIGLGYPLDAGKIPYSAKRPNENVLLFNERVKDNSI
ncbi:nitroreductase family protein [Olivibacter jilunii]|uniref:nitroreductase family protein n=1 Tax=Olivibacter jilunii TaxID=985016 RepID=UPI003F17BC8A